MNQHEGLATCDPAVTEAYSEPVSSEAEQPPSRSQRPMKPLRKSLRQSLRKASPVKRTDETESTDGDKGEGPSIPKPKSKARASAAAKRKGSGIPSLRPEPPLPQATEEVTDNANRREALISGQLLDIPESGETLEDAPEVPEERLEALRLDDDVHQGHGPRESDSKCSTSLKDCEAPGSATDPILKPSDTQSPLLPCEASTSLYDVPALPSVTISKRTIDEDNTSEGQGPCENQASSSTTRNLKKARLDHNSPAEAINMKSGPQRPRIKADEKRRRRSGPRLSGSNSRNLLGKSKARAPAAVRRLNTTRSTAATTSGPARSVSATKVSTAPSVKSKPKTTTGTGLTCGLTIPNAPTFSSGSLRQQRLLAKAEREKDSGVGADAENSTRSRVYKTGAVSGVAHGRAPLIDKKQACHFTSPLKLLC